MNYYVLLIAFFVFLLIKWIKEKWWGEFQKLKHIGLINIIERVTVETKYRKFLNYFIPFFIAIALCVIVSRQERVIGPKSPDNIDTFFSFSEGVDHYKDIRQEWRPRIASNFLAGILIKIMYSPGQITDKTEAIKYIAGNWTAAWLFSCYLILILIFKEKSLLYLFGIFAGISFAYTPFIGDTRIYPWDLPALFVFCFFISIIKTKREEWLIVFVPLALLFKETSFLMIIAFLFWNNVPTRKKFIFIGITLIASALIKTGVDIITTNPSPLITMTTKLESGASYFIYNLRFLLKLRPDSILFVDAGLLLALLLLPIKQHPIALLKLIAVTFILGNFVFGVISEFRIFFEMIPLSLYALDVYFSPAKKDNSVLSPEINATP